MLLMMFLLLVVVRSCTTDVYDIDSNKCEGLTEVLSQHIDVNQGIDDNVTLVSILSKINRKISVM